MGELDEEKQAPAQTGILDVIRHRWSPRAWSDRTVGDEDLRKIFTAGGWAASSTNEQPWRFLFGRRGDATFGKILEALAEGNQGWAKNAAVLILSVAKREFSSGGAAGKPNGYALHDTGAASANMSLQATALGLHTHGMAGFDKDKARRAFGVPEEYEMGACWALGYLGDPETLPQPLKDRELAPRTRKPLDEIVFTDWGVPAHL